MRTFLKPLGYFRLLLHTFIEFSEVRIVGDSIRTVLNHVCKEMEDGQVCISQLKREREREREEKKRREEREKEGKEGEREGGREGEGEGEGERERESEREGEGGGKL